MNRLFLIGIGVLIVAQAGFSEKPGPSVLSERPWDAQALAQGAKVIYGQDDRIDVYEESDAQRLAWAASTCALVDSYQLHEQEDGSYTMDAYEYTVSGMPPCDGEPFAGQPAAAFCTGFVVGPDLIATAGHCLNESTIHINSIVFGFQMEDANSPVLSFSADQVYHGVEVLGWQSDEEGDFAVVRLDRPIAAPGVSILEVRSSGAVPVGASVGVIGHPAGLPTKIAFGAESLVRDSADPFYFMTNLDTFGGNSGSPVFNVETGFVEGILVYGEEDYVLGDDCFSSNVIDVDAGMGEGVTKSTLFSKYIQTGLGQISLDQVRYGCDAEVTIYVSDQDLDEVDSTTVQVFSDLGDVETVTLTQSIFPGTFEGPLTLQENASTPEDGVLQVMEGYALVAIYHDEDDGWGRPASVSAGASIDCTAPVLSRIASDFSGSKKAGVQCDTDEPAFVTVYLADECGASARVIESDDLTTSHYLVLEGLDPLSTYYYTVEAKDTAENTTLDDNAGACYSFTTTEYKDSFTTFIEAASPDWGFDHQTITFTPVDSTSGYSACIRSATKYPTWPFAGKRLWLDDDDAEEIALKKGKSFPFYGQTYDTIYVGSNGYITFGEADRSYAPLPQYHFRLPRVAGYFGDLSPGLLEKIMVQQLDDRVAVTFDGVSDWWGDKQHFQMELFFDGRIRITLLELNIPLAIIGLSDGQGEAFGFEYSVFSNYPSCDGEEEEDPWPGCAGGSIGAGRPPMNGASMEWLLTIFVLCASFLAWRRFQVQQDRENAHADY